MKDRIFAAMLLGILALGSLTGCAGGSGQSADRSVLGQNAAEQTDAAQSGSEQTDAEQPNTEQTQVAESGEAQEQSDTEQLMTAESTEDEEDALQTHNELGQLGEEGWHYSSDYPNGNEVVIYETTADITHDGIADRILVVGYSIEDNAGVENVLSIASDGCYVKLYRGLQDGSFETTARFISRNYHAAHAGNGTVCLTHVEGMDYLLFSSIYEMQGMADYSFALAYVDDEEGIAVVDSEEVEFTFGEAGSGGEPAGEERASTVPAFEEKLSPYLENATILLSLNVDTETFYSTEEEECPASAFFDLVWSRD